jgi:hypothetical protein
VRVAGGEEGGVGEVEVLGGERGFGEHIFMGPVLEACGLS